MAEFCVPNLRGDRCGYGICDTGGYTCTCDEGYEKDYLQRRHANCFLPTIAKHVLFTVIGLMGFLAMVWSARELRKAQRKATALKLLRIAFIGGLFSMIYPICVALEGGHGPASVVALILLFFTLAIYGVEQILWSMISPIFAVSKQDPKPYTRLVRGGLAVIFLAFAGAWISTIAFIIMFRMIEYNLAVTAGMIVVVVESIFVACVVGFTLKHLLKTIDATRNGALRLRQVPDTPSTSRGDGGVSASDDDPVQRYRAQAKRMSQRVVAMCIVIAASGTIIVVLDLALHVYPYRWVLYFLIMSGFPAFSIVIVEYCKRSLAKTSSRKGDATTGDSKGSKGSKVLDGANAIVAQPAGSATIGSVDQTTVQF